MIRQFTVRLDNRPGALEAMIGLLASAGVNLRALEVSERGNGDHGVCHFIASDVAKAEKALSEKGYRCELSEVVVVAMDDKVGGLFAVLAALTGQQVNIKYLYAFVTQVQGKSMAVFGVENPGKVAEMLAQKGISVITRSSAVEGETGPADETQAQHPERVDALDYYLGGTFYW